MDVSLVLTHRCNLACGYCYAGEHHRAEMPPDTADRAVDLLFDSPGDPVQLSFFGGEPFLAFPSMQRAVLRARERAEACNRTLLIQCTTNGAALSDEHVRFVVEHGIRCTVSIDGVREAHDLNRRCTGGASSYDRVHGGLRALIDAGANPDAMMVITPETVPYTFRSVGFLWDEGARRVRANMLLDAPWTAADRDELREHLLAVSCELVARRARGEQVVFQPFEAGMQRERTKRRRTVTAAACGGTPQKRAQIVVGTGGNLYPCAPMVGEDRDDGPEAALRLGHLDDGATAITGRVSRDGAGCGDGKGCACAAYLETGDRYTTGKHGAWYARVCDELGAAIVIALASVPGQREGTSRRPFLFGIAAMGGAALLAPAMLRAGLFAGDEPGCSETVSGAIEEVHPIPPPAPPVPPPAPHVQVEGGISAPPVPEETIDGEMPAEPMVKGDIAAPPAPEPAVPGQLMAPPEVVRGDLK